MPAGQDNVFRALKEFGLRGTFTKLFQQRALKFGRHVGTDRYGNKYYENLEYAWGQTRWVEYAGGHSFYDVDSSLVPAEWHTWLHQTTDEPPQQKDKNIGSTWRYEPEKTINHSDAKYERNLGGVIEEHFPNNTTRRPRGYGVGNGLTGPMAAGPGEHYYYTQPGHPLDKRNFKPKREVPWSLKDTPETLRRREKLEDAAAGRLPRTEVSKLLEEGEAGTFAGGDDVELTEEEQRFAEKENVVLDDDGKLQDLKEHITMLRGIIAEYERLKKPAITGKGLEQAKKELEEYEYRYNMHKNIIQKLKVAQNLM